MLGAKELDQANPLSDVPIVNANDFASIMTGTAFGAVLEDDLWQMFGYKRRPRRGHWFNRFVKEDKLVKENFLARELTLVSLARLIPPLRKLPEIEKSIAVVARILEMVVEGERPSTQIWKVSMGFPSKDAAIDFFMAGLARYCGTTVEECGPIFVERMMEVVDENSKAIWLLGAARLFSGSAFLFLDNLDEGVR